MNILLADDHEDTREGYALFLRMAGHTVHAAADGLSALDLAATALPDVVIVDLRLPDIDGHEVARFLKNDPRTRHIPVILFTAAVSAKDPAADRGMADACVGKPCVPADLLATIVRLTRTSMHKPPSPQALDAPCER